VAGRPPHYDLKCWHNRRDDEAPHAVRFHVPDDGDVTINDLIRGEVTWKKESLGDFIVVRSDGLPTYNYSVVIDDHEMEITHVIRAEENLTNTHRQVLIYRAMKWSVPEFAHVSLILGPDRTKLSKRHGATSVSQDADDGVLPDAMFNYLTPQGWSWPDVAEVFSREHAIARFALDRVNSAPAIFDHQKLEWLNGQYIHSMSAAELLPLVARFFDVSWLEEGIDVVKTSVHLLTQFAEALRFVREYAPPQIERPFAESLVKELRTNGTPIDETSFKAMVERLKTATGLKGKALFMPLRLALTGSDHGPELVRAIPLLERASNVDSSVVSPLQRAEQCINKPQMQLQQVAVVSRHPASQRLDEFGSFLPGVSPCELCEHVGVRLAIDDRLEDARVHVVEAEFVHVDHPERLIRDALGDDAVCPYLGVVADAA